MLDTLQRYNTFLHTLWGKFHKQGETMDTASIMMMLQDKLPKDPASVTALREKLDKTSEAKKDELMKNLPFLNLKSPALVFWVGAFLFGWIGLGRFMIGDKLHGGLRLGMLILCIIVDIAGMSVIAQGLGSWFLIWQIVDLFFIGKKTRKKNLDKILQAL